MDTVRAKTSTNSVFVLTLVLSRYGYGLQIKLRYEYETKSEEDGEAYSADDIHRALTNEKKRCQEDAKIHEWELKDTEESSKQAATGSFAFDCGPTSRFTFAGSAFGGSSCADETAGESSKPAATGGFHFNSGSSSGFTFAGSSSTGATAGGNPFGGIFFGSGNSSSAECANRPDPMSHSVGTAEKISSEIRGSVSGNNFSFGIDGNSTTPTDNLNPDPPSTIKAVFENCGKCGRIQHSKSFFHLPVQSTVICPLNCSPMGP